MKKVAIALGAVLTLFVVVAVVVPLAVNVDKYRPQIVQAADQQINGKVELGKLSLSLWGQVRIEVAGLSVADEAGRRILSVKDAYFHLPLFSLLTGAPVITFKMWRPEVNVLKGRDGKMNILKLVKSSPAAQATAPKAAPQPGAGTAGTVALPAIATRARLGVELRDAEVVFKDAATGLESKISDFNFVLQDVSLSHPTKLEIWADLDTKMAAVFAVKGRLTITGTATPTLRGDKLAAALAMKADFDKLDIRAGDAFHKASGMPANVELEASYDENEARIQKLVGRFFNAEIQAHGGISNGPTQTVNLEISSNAIDLKPWAELVPALKGYDLAGKAGLEAQVTGPLEKYAYKAKVRIDGLTAKAPGLKAQPRFDLFVAVANDVVEPLTLTMKSPGCDLSVKGKIVSFSKPRVDLTIASSSLDLDQLVDFPPPAKSSGHAAASGPSAAEAKIAPGEGTDAELAPLRASPALTALAATVGFHFGTIQAQGTKITDLGGKLTFRDLTAGLEGFKLKVFGGDVQAKLLAQIRPRVPTYQFSAQVEHLDLHQAVESQFQAFKNTVLGIASFNITGSGASFNTVPAEKALQAKGSFKVQNAQFTTIDVTKLATDAINKGLASAASKIPQLGGKRVNNPSGARGGYDLVSSSFTIAGGKLSAPDFTAKAHPGQSLDASGSTVVGLVDSSLNTNWTLADTYNITHASDFSVPVGDTNVDHVLADGGVVKLPVHCGCTTASPCCDYAKAPEYLASVALKNFQRAGEQVAKAKAAQAIRKVVPQSAPPAVQKALKRWGF